MKNQNEKPDVEHQDDTNAQGAKMLGTHVGATVGGALGLAGGMAAGAASGAGAGLLGGPAGAALGLVVGAVVGGLAGQTATEKVTDEYEKEDDYWRENYQSEPYYKAGEQYDQYSSAFRAGYTGRSRHFGKSFDEVESDLQNDYDTHKGDTAVTWEHGKHAARSAWNRIGDNGAVKSLQV